MDEIRNIKRLVNLSPEEERELDSAGEKYMDLMKQVIRSYDSFESGKVKVGRLKILLGNVTYKVNFSYKDLYRVAQELREVYENAERPDIGDSLKKEIEDFLSRNREMKEFTS